MERKYAEQLILALFVIALMLVTGTILFHTLEGWTYTDSFYFTGITVTTLGYGDLVPSTSTSKIITVIFAFVGIGVVLYGITLTARLAIEQEQEQIEELLQRRVKKRLAEEEKARESVKKEAEQMAKEVEKEAVKIVKELTETEKKAKRK